MKFPYKKTLLITATCFMLCGCGSKTDPTPTPKPDPTPTNLLDKWDAEDVYKYTYRGLEEDEMPISGWIAPSSLYNCNTNAQYKILHDSGLNSICALYENWTSGDRNEVFKALEYAGNNDISYFIRDTSIASLSEDLSDLSELQKHIDEFMDYDGFGGFFPCDEPSKDQFPSLRQGSLGMQLIDPSLMYYCNLFPNYANVETQLKSKDYTDYVESFIKTVQPQFVSYDFYGNRGTFPRVTGDYFGQLDTVSSLCQQYGLPFWTFVCSTAHDDLRAPNKADLGWQIHTDLAYGAKGIQYFCYQTPSEFDGFQDNGTSLVDRQGRTTEIYNIAQAFNKQIQRMDHVLMNSTCIAKMAYNESPRPIDNQEVTTLRSCREIKSIDTKDDLLVGCFDYGGKSAFYFVNNSLTDTMNAEVNFTSYVEATTYALYDDDEFKGEKASITLEPGEAILYELTNYKD